jgi:hypothetical protein
MRREDLTREQAEAISKQIGPMLGYRPWPNAARTSGVGQVNNA